MAPSLLNQLVCGLITQLKNERDAAKASLELLHHRGVTCDGCSVKPIKGLRFKCQVCDDYDLCELCHASNVHQVGHRFNQKPRFVSELLS